MSSPNPFEQAFRRACDHANAGPNLDGMTYAEARMALALWSAPPPLFTGPKLDAWQNARACPDCGEQVGFYLAVG